MSSTPPVSKDGFVYANDSFFAEASNQNRHRRATLPELQSLFHPSTSTTKTAAEKEPVGHWYEAQLLHYGLPPSKSKAVAKTRLLDAMNKGTLSIPEHIRKLEVELKKDWLKNERLAKKAVKDQKTSGVAGGAKAKNGELGRGKDATKGKRKRDEEGNTDGRAINVNVSLNLGTAGLPAGESASPKRAKQTARRGGSKVTETESTRTPARSPKQTARRGGSNVGTTESERAAARPKQTARYSGPPRGAASTRGRAISTSGRSRRTAGTKHEVTTSPSSHDASSQSSQPRRQTARRSRPFFPGRGRGAFTSGRVKHEPDSEDEVKEEGSFKEEDSDDSNEWGGEWGSYSSNTYSKDDGGSNQSRTPPELGPLGLINGKYAVQSSALDDWGPMFDSEDFSLILCLEGNSIWGAYDFGMHSGILHLRERPWNSSFDEIPFSWRGRENSEGQMSFGSSNHGWIQFLGDGHIEGMINCYGQARFSGERISGNRETKAPRDARSMKNEWEGYNQIEYDRVNRARWGGSGW